MEGYLMIILVVALYFVPTIICGVKARKNGGAIAALNLLLGWTVIGWVVALIWAISEDK